MKGEWKRKEKEKSQRVNREQIRLFRFSFLAFKQEKHHGTSFLEKYDTKETINMLRFPSI